MNKQKKVYTKPKVTTEQIELGIFGNYCKPKKHGWGHGGFGGFGGPGGPGGFGGFGGPGGPGGFGGPGGYHGGRP